MVSERLLPDGFFGEDDIREYRRLVSQLHDGDTLVELGVWIGRSLCSIADLITEKHLKVIAVDTFTKLRAHGKPPLTKPQIEVFRENMRAVGVEPQCMRLPSHLAADYVHGDVAMVFIDADHHYESVKADIAAWHPKVTRILAGHDYGHPKFGVKKAVDELFPQAHTTGRMWSVGAS